VDDEDDVEDQSDELEAKRSGTTRGPQSPAWHQVVAIRTRARSGAHRPAGREGQDEPVIEEYWQQYTTRATRPLTEELLEEIERPTLHGHRPIILASRQPHTRPTTRPSLPTPAPFYQNNRKLFGSSSPHRAGRAYADVRPAHLHGDHDAIWVLLDGQGLGHDKRATRSPPVPPELAKNFSRRLISSWTAPCRNDGEAPIRLKT